MIYSNNVLLANGDVKNTTEITLNDTLIGADNQNVSIFNTELIKNTNIYEITTKTGTKFYVDEDALIATYRNSEIVDVPVKDICKLDEVAIRNKGYRLYRVSEVKFICNFVLPTNPVMYRLNDVTGYFEYDYDNYNLPIEPYLFGLMLLNLSSFSGGVKMTISNELVKERLQPFFDKYSLETRAILKGVNNSYQIVKKNKSRNKNPLYQILENLGLADVITKERFIPSIYKTASVEDRYALLAAICDFSGCINGKGYQLITSSIRFAEDIVFIARTLGLNAKFSNVIKNNKPYCNINIGGNAYKIPCLIKKIKTDKIDDTYFVTRNFNIKYVGVGDFIKINASDRYLLDDCTIVS